MPQFYTTISGYGEGWHLLKFLNPLNVYAPAIGLRDKPVIQRLSFIILVYNWFSVLFLFMD